MLSKFRDRLSAGRASATDRSNTYRATGSFTGVTPSSSGATTQPLTQPTMPTAPTAPSATGADGWAQLQHLTTNDGNWWNMFGNTGRSGVSGGAAPTGATSSPGGALADAQENERLQEAANFFNNQPDWTYYQPLDESTLAGRAQEYADLYANPQMQELEFKLEQAIANAAAQEQQIRGAYAGTWDALGRREAEQRRLDVESAIARGGGRSGVVEHLSGQRQEHFGELLAAEEAKKSAELSNIANQLGLIQQQVPDQRMAIQDQASRLASQELARLQELDYTRGREHDMDQWQRALGVFDRTMLTPVEQLQLYMMLADSAGKFPEQVPSIYGT